MLRTAWIAIVVMAVSLPVPAGDGGHRGSLSPNVLLTITVSKGGDSSVKTYSLLARGDGTQAGLTMGWRVPIPTSTFSGKEDGPTGGSTTSYTYQNVGLTAHVRAKVIDDVVALRGEIDVSTARSATRDSAGVPLAPTIGTFQQEFSVLLDERTPLELASVSNPDGGTLSIRIEADILN
jgi:hypothetical protein